jgi:glycosyltransferase involved in cell wall biosynthesis
MVSVIIPTYNRAGSLECAIKSVIDQTYGNIEVIIIVDNPCDESIKLKYKYESDNVVFYVLEKNVGGAEARNIGIKKARGTYVAFLDDDDVWYPNKISDQVRFMEQNQEYCIVSCGYVENNSNKKILYRTGKITKSDMLYENYLGSFSFCVTRAEYLKDIKINNSLKACQDWDLWNKIMKKTDKEAYRMDSVLVRYDNDNDKLRLSTDKKNFNKSFIEFIGVYSDVMSLEQYWYNMSRYYALKNEVKGHIVDYIKSILYSTMAIKVVGAKRYIKVLFPFLVKVLRRI